MDEDEEFAKRFALKPIKPDERMHQIRYVRPELVEKLRPTLERRKEDGREEDHARWRNEPRLF